MTTSTRPPLAYGDAPIVHRVPGSPATVTLQNTGAVESVFRVDVAQGPHQPDGWTCTYGDEQTARVEARRAAELFAVHGTAEATEARRAELTAVIAEQHRRPARGMHDAELLAAAQDELDSLDTLADRALLAQLRDSLDHPATQEA